MLSASRNFRHLLANPGACSLVLQRGMALDGLSGFSERETAREVSFVVSYVASSRSA